MSLVNTASEFFNRKRDVSLTEFEAATLVTFIEEQAPAWLLGDENFSDLLVVMLGISDKITNTFRLIAEEVPVD